MKNLANCKPSEFVVQTNKIRKSVSKWLTDTDVMTIRKRMPDIPDDATDAEVRAAMEKQATENFEAILDAVLEEHPMETLGLLALMCFVEPENVDDHEMTEYLEAFSELMSNKAVLDFFISLMLLVRRLSSTTLGA